MLETLERICANDSKPDDLALLERIGSNMKVGSLCGHGQLGYNPISSALKYFEDEFRARLEGNLAPAGGLGDGSMIVPTRTRP